MFIIHTTKGKVFTENQEIEDPKNKEKKKRLSWDDIFKDVRISVLQLVYPFPVRFKKPDGSLAEPFTPKLTIKGYSRYYFFNEASVPLMIKGEQVVRQGVPELKAKTIAGIDDNGGTVTEFRMDKFGNVNTNKYSLKKLNALIKSGTFRGEIIRNGN